MTLATVPRYDGEQASEWGEQAVVVGAGIAGLLAARVLAGGFDEVTVLDRDPLTDESVARHIHVLLKGGESTIEDLFPGYGEELLSAGGVVFDGSRDVSFYAEGDYLADGPWRLPPVRRDAVVVRTVTPAARRRSRRHPELPSGDAAHPRDAVSQTVTCASAILLTTPREPRVCTVVPSSRSSPRSSQAVPFAGRSSAAT
ncbi:hypothetical protein [Haloprofundus halobius]|uniref:hypothetical protein n=1 Tax=Haloprofundus halobius TaxID=2876194 RepID=UPI001CCBF69E|nr:hypothetical protein [Haloprofundus halobius]